jgi:hypothetical protein
VPPAETHAFEEPPGLAVPDDGSVVEEEEDAMAVAAELRGVCWGRWAESQS